MTEISCTIKQARCTFIVTHVIRRFLLEISYTMPPRFVPHRWLSCYDVTLAALRMLDVFSVFYFAFVPKEDFSVYHGIILSIYRNKSLGEQSKARLSDLLKGLRAKNMTEDGKKRKARIVQQLFTMRTQTRLIMSFYVAVLLILKKYVCLFESKQPLIHRLHEEQVSVFLEFLACFVCPESLEDITISQLLGMDFSDVALHQKKGDMFIGAGTKKVVAELRLKYKDSLVGDFFQQALTAYMDCANYMRGKLPLNNNLLRNAAALDPCNRKKSSSLKKLKRLPSLVPNVLRDLELEAYEQEVHAFQVALNLPNPMLENGKPVRIDSWWASVSSTGKFPALCKLGLALLTCFHGPQVEASFSMMGDILDSRSARMNVKTYAAIQTVKYHLLANEKSAVGFFKRGDPLRSPIRANIVRSVQRARGLYGRELEEEKKVREERAVAKKVQTAGKAARAKLALELAERSAKENHLKLLQKKRKAAAARKPAQKKRKLE